MRPLTESLPVLGRAAFNCPDNERAKMRPSSNFAAHLKPTHRVPPFSETLRQIVSWWRGAEPGWRERFKEAQLIDEIATQKVEGRSQRKGAIVPCSWKPEEFKVESSEHQDNANIHCQPFPKSVSEEPEIYTDYDGYHRHHVKHYSYLSAHGADNSVFLRPVEAVDAVHNPARFRFTFKSGHVRCN